MAVRCRSEATSPTDMEERVTVMDVSTARNLNLRRSRLAIASALVLASASIIVVQLRATRRRRFPRP